MSVPTLSPYSSTSCTPQTSLPIKKHCDDPQNEECGPVANATSSTGYEPNVIENFDCSETCTAIFQNAFVDVDTEPSYSFGAELDDELIRKAPSSPLFTQEREEPAGRRQTYHSHEESLLPAQSFFAHASTARPVHELSSHQKRKSSRENETIRILFERQKSKFSLILEPRFGNTSFKPMNNFDEIKYYFMNNYQNKIVIFVKQKEDRFLRGRQITYLIYDHFRVTGSHDSVENYTDLFTIVLRNDDIQEFDSKWDGILLSMTKIPHDDILEGLYKIKNTTV